MKLGQFIEYNMRTIFPEHSYTKCGEEATPKTLYKKSKLSIYLDQQSESYKVCYYCYVQVEVYQIILTLRR